MFVIDELSLVKYFFMISSMRSHIRGRSLFELDQKLAWRPSLKFGFSSCVTSSFGQFQDLAQVEDVKLCKSDFEFFEFFFWSLKLSKFISP